MILNISSNDLLKGLLDVAKAIPAKTALPILENFLFVLRDGTLEVTASDTELTLRTSIPVDGAEEEGSMAVPARHMIDLLKELPDQPLRIRTVSDASFECSWASGNSVLPYFPADDYPEIKNVSDDAQQVTFPASVLSDGISSTVYATSDNEIRPNMNGIFFDIDVDSTTLVASDSFKLICYTTAETRASERSSFILNKKYANILRAIVGKETETVDIAFDTNSARFTLGGTTMICRLIVGKYPKYRDVIPQNNTNILRIDRQLLLNTVRRVAVCSNKGSNHIKFTLKEGQLEVFAQDLGFALAAYEKLSCDYSGDEITIGFKSTFLSEILSNMSCNTLLVKLADVRRAALILPAEEEPDSAKICAMLMPVAIK